MPAGFLLIPRPCVPGRHSERSEGSLLDSSVAQRVAVQPHTFIHHRQSRQNTPRTPATALPSRRAPHTSPVSPPHIHSSTTTRFRVRHPYSRRRNKYETSPAFSCRCCNSVPLGALLPGTRRSVTFPCASFLRWCSRRKS